MGLNKYLRPASRPPKALLLVIFSSIVASAGALIALKNTFEDSRAMAYEILKLKAAIRPLPRPTKAEQERHEQWIKLQAERNFDWYPIFLALERASSEDIELLEFRPDKANRQLVLRGEARDMNALTNYLDQLTVQKMISQPYLSHQKLAPRDGLQIVSFEIRASIGNNETVSSSQRR